MHVYKYTNRMRMNMWWGVWISILWSSIKYCNLYTFNQVHKYEQIIYMQICCNRVAAMLYCCVSWWWCAYSSFLFFSLSFISMYICIIKSIRERKYSYIYAHSMFVCESSIHTWCVWCMYHIIIISKIFIFISIIIKIVIWMYYKQILKINFIILCLKLKI